MPIYVYKREDGEIIEIKQRITEDALTIDPDTGQSIQRIIQPVTAQYRGAGFYKTDNPRLVKEVWSQRGIKKPSESKDKSDAHIPIDN